MHVELEVLFLLPIFYILLCSLNLLALKLKQSHFDWFLSLGVYHLEDFIMPIGNWMLYIMSSLNADVIINVNP